MLNGSLLLFGELLLNGRVVPKIDLGSYDEARDSRAVVVNLREPLLLDVLERGWGGDREADEEDWVGGDGEEKENEVRMERERRGKGVGEKTSWATLQGEREVELTVGLRIGKGSKSVVILLTWRSARRRRDR